ncbi:hypothetical protein JavanS299_0003 [Streptococcus satellite phage Javan299]|nr:hypothetical protein JavanS299_0003 [Streptococcus satellite phage Javan299]
MSIVQKQRKLKNRKPILQTKAQKTAKLQNSNKKDKLATANLSNST